MVNITNNNFIKKLANVTYVLYTNAVSTKNNSDINMQNFNCKRIAKDLVLLKSQGKISNELYVLISSELIKFAVVKNKQDYNYIRPILNVGYDAEKTITGYEQFKKVVQIHNFLEDDFYLYGDYSYVKDEIDNALHNLINTHGVNDDVNLFIQTYAQNVITGYQKFYSNLQRKNELGCMHYIDEEDMI